MFFPVISNKTGTAEYAVCDATENDGSHDDDTMIAFRTSVWQDVTEGEEKISPTSISKWWILDKYNGHSNENWQNYTVSYNII